MNLSPHLSSKLLLDESMRPHTYAGIGGRALYFIPVNSLDELREARAFGRSEKLDVRMIGGGSNVLVSDLGVEALVVALTGAAFDGFRIAGNTITVGAACPLSRLVNASADAGLAGLEGLTGIPGTVGGALCMNAGGRHGSAADMLKAITVMTDGNEPQVLARDAVDFGYRSAGLAPETAILEAVFELKPETADRIRDRRDSIMKAKLASQPLHEASCGCAFKNPPGQLSAGAIIDRLGFKGQREGNIAVSQVHANFLVNCGKGRARDMVALMERIYTAAEKEYDVKLEPEIIFWGDCGWNH